MNTPLPLILGSSSIFRRAQLEKLGLPFETATPDFDEKAAEAYIKRCQEFRKKYGRPPLINDLLEHRANLRHHPDHTIGLISKSLDTANAKQTAWELLALVTYSSCTTEEIGSYVTKLIEKVCADPADVSAVQDEYQKLLGR